MPSSFRHHPEAFTPASDLPLLRTHDRHPLPPHVPKQIADTSILAYRAIAPSLPEREQQVLDTLATFREPPTAYEIARRMMQNGLILDVNMARPRLTRLHQRERVKHGPKRACAVTGHCVYTWSVR
jgi:hypothetical protein